MELKDIILDYKNRYQLSNKEIAQQFHVTHITVGRWLRGEVKTIQEETAQNMSRVLGYDVQSVLQGTAITLKKPVLGMAKAGYDMFLENDYLGEESVSLEEYQRGDYFLKVEGDSMINAGIVDGSYIYVHQCETVKNGDIALIRIGDEVTIKRYYKDRTKVELVAENPTVEPRVFTSKEAETLPVKVIGKVLFVKHYL